MLNKENVSKIIIAIRIQFRMKAVALALSLSLSLSYLPKECAAVCNSKLVHVCLCSEVDLKRVELLEVFVDGAIHLTVVRIRPTLEAASVDVRGKFEERIS